MDNTADAISWIRGWSIKDPERFQPVDDSRDIDDDSIEVSVANSTIPNKTEPDIISINATEITNKSDTDDVIFYVNKIDHRKKTELADASNAILGSWHAIPDPQKLSVLITMYGRVGPNPDDQDFNNSIEEFDRDRNYFYSSKIEASEDLDNMYENRHSETCEHKKIKPNEEGSINCEPKKEDSIKSMVLNVNNRKYYSLSWEEIAEAAELDGFLVDLKHTLLTNNHEKLTELLQGKAIHCPDNAN